MMPLESLSSTALEVWRHGLTDHCQASPSIIERLESETGGLYAPSAVSEALRELERAGWCKRLMLGFRRVDAHKSSVENRNLPL